MPCQKCLEKPNYHSFMNFGSMGDTQLFYTAPAKTEDLNEDGTKLANITIHVNEETSGSPWIWVLDCENMGFKHYTDVSFNIGLLDLLSKSPTLKEVWIVRSNFWVQAVHTFFQKISSAKIVQNVKYVDGTLLERMMKLESMGLSGEEMNWLIRQ